MRKIYIDGGAYSKDSFAQFSLDGFEIFAFDPIPKAEGIIPKAMGTFDGKTMMAVNHDRPMASTIEKGNMLYNNGIFPFHHTHPEKEPNKVEMIEVEVFDFPKWFRDNFCKDDYIIFKADIEGSEFDILEQMIKDNTISWLDELYCEFHSFHMPEYKEKEMAIRKFIKDNNINFKEWD
ncbi:MAG: FkbM family methyltransferase [Candidatus Heimdallarchaeaceae archaeon]